MLVTLDLSVRQAARVITQAVRTRAKLEIEPRPDFPFEPLWGIVASRDQDVLSVELLNARGEAPIRALIGAMCDARTILSQQLYMFETAVVDVSECTAPIRILLTVPATIRVANRRRFSRRSPVETVPIRLVPQGATQPIIGVLTDLSRNGVGCRVPRAGAEELMLIGERLDAEFTLPWSKTIYALSSIVCSKSACQGSDEMSLGIEFSPVGAAQQATLDLFRSMLETEHERLLDTEAGA